METGMPCWIGLGAFNNIINDYVAPSDYQPELDHQFGVEEKDSIMVVAVASLVAASLVAASSVTISVTFAISKELHIIMKDGINHFRIDRNSLE
jgi:hypothetical protein